MCGIVGLACKTDRYVAELGALVTNMLDALTSRGPDSAGVAIYERDVAEHAWKYSLHVPAKAYDWARLGSGLAEAVGQEVEVRRRGSGAVLVSDAGPELVRPILHEMDPHVALFGFGHAIEVFKDVGAARGVCERYGVPTMTGYQAVGHTRMATESDVTVAHSHPFAPTPDLALVHNGAFSNYSTLRRELADEGIICDTDNDSEVAARFLGAEMTGPASLSESLGLLRKRFDGFFTLLVTTDTEFAVVRDSFACKPMVVAETQDYVAVGSEYVSLAELPGVEDARVFEPDPEEVYSWTTQLP